MTTSQLNFSHIGLYAFDYEALADFYKECLGFVETDRGDIDGVVDLIFMTRDPKEHHQVVVASGRTAARDTKLLNQISFRIPDLETLKKIAKSIERDGRGSAFSAVNHGCAWAVYFNDPEGNRIELFTDSPWYIPQPCKGALDLDKPTEQILTETEAMCRAEPGYRPMSEFQAEVAQKLALN